MATCPNGHESTWDDYCSSCGAAMSGDPDASSADAVAAPADADGAADAAPPGGAACPNCGESHRPTDVFCENCGYDFLAGSLPGATGQDPAVAGPASVLAADDAAAPPPDPGAGASIGAGDVGSPGWSLLVEVDPDYFASVSGDAGLTLPDPLPDATTVAVSDAAKLLVGRRSESRAVYPEIDLELVTGDPAVSTRHALVAAGPNGTLSVTDLDSTNGTFLRGAADPMAPGAAVALDEGDTIHLGAWTRITVAAT